MCNTRFHEHWCSGCGKNLNKEPMDSYVEIEWSQSENGEIIHDKKMLCDTCLGGGVRFLPVLKYGASATPAPRRTK